MRVGRASATTWVCRATWTQPSCSGPPRAWSTGRDACSGSRPVAQATSSTSAMAYSRPVRSKTSRRSSRRFAKECPPLPDAKTGVLCMAYGSPAGTDENDGIEPYYAHIRGGRKPSLEALAELRERYRAIGGSPLTEMTRAHARALAARLGLPVFAGMKHAPPFIADAAAEARSAGIERFVGLPLAAHYAEMSLGAYFASLRQAWDGDLILVRGFHDHPAFIAAVRNLLAEALVDFEPERIFFTAHSLPARIEATGDPYRERLLESCRLVAEGSAMPEWEFAFQSASPTAHPCLAPTLLDSLPPTDTRP